MFRTPIVVLIIFSFIGYSCSTTYVNVWVKQFKGLMKPDANKYKALSYPTDNFGVGTMWSDQPSPERLECAMLDCFNIAIANKEQWLDLNGNVRNGGGAPVNLNQKNFNKIGAEAVLPSIDSLLSLNGKLNLESTKISSVNFDRGIIRFINREKLKQLFTALPNDSNLKALFSQGRLVIVYSDVVLENMSVTVNVNSATSGEIDAKITGVPSIKNAKLGVGVTKNSEGTYTFKSVKPLIVLRYLKKQPGGVAVEDEDKKYDVATWNDL